MNQKSIMIIIIATLLSGTAHAQDLFYDNPVIAEIDFEGLINSKESDLNSLMYVEVGDVLDESKLNDTLKLLFALDRYSDAEVDIKEGDEGLILTFTLEENPLIGEIEIEGNESVRKIDIEDVLTVSEDSYLTDSKLNSSINEIVLLYEEDGFVEVSVTSELEAVDVSQNTYDLKFIIDEGKKIVVEKINITGAENITASEIKGVMQTKEKVFILQSGVLDEATFLSDMELIQALYQREGYLDVQLNDYHWDIEELGEDDKAHKAIVIYIDLHEGDQYFVGSINITNNTLFSDEDLMEFIDLDEGDVYNELTMEIAKYSIYNEYSDHGYLYANVSLLQEFDYTNHVVDTTFYIFEGPRAHIESITISGNDKTLTNVIERELLFEEGEMYVQSKVADSYELLVFTQYFSDIQFVPTPGSAEGLIGLDIEVEEQRTGLLSFGVGYGTESGLNATAMVTEQNLLGTGRTLSFKGEYGTIRQLLELSFKEPWLFDTPTFASVSISYSRYLYDDIATDDDGDGFIDGTTNTFNYISNSTETLDYFSSTNEYTRQSFGFGASISRRFWVDWYGYLSYAFSMYKDMDANFTTPLIFSGTWQTNTDLIESLAEDWTLKHTIGIGVSVDTSDDPINPLNGFSGSLYAYYIGGIFGGTIHYIKPKINLNYYWNFWRNFVLATHFSTEFILPQFNGTKEYDTTDQLWFDGVYEMRGFQSYLSYGESKVFYSGEIRFPIYEDALWGLVFFDLGAIWPDYDGWTFAGENYIGSFGVGIKINYPQLPIRLYLARTMSFDTELGKFQLNMDDPDEGQNIFKNWEFVFSIQGLF